MPNTGRRFPASSPLPFLLNPQPDRVPSEQKKAETEGSEDTLTLDYTCSVDLDPSKGGKHVQAGLLLVKNEDLGHISV